MATVVHRFDWPDRFVVGTIGAPGERTFYLQARTGREVVSVAIEKMQAAALADGVDHLLDQVMAEEGNPASVPPRAPEGLRDDDPLDGPVFEQFRAGEMTLGFDASTAQVVIQALPMADAEDAEPLEALVVQLPVGSARAFAARSRLVVAAGRRPS